MLVHLQCLLQVLTHNRTGRWRIYLTWLEASISIFIRIQLWLLRVRRQVWLMQIIYYRLLIFTWSQWKTEWLESYWSLERPGWFSKYLPVSVAPAVYWLASHMYCSVYQTGWYTLGILSCGLSEVIESMPMSPMLGHSCISMSTTAKY